MKISEKPASWITNRAGFSPPFAEWAFAESTPLYKALAAQDREGNAYLLWKTKEEPAYVPTFEQARDKVAQTWKMIKARDLARKRADEYATQARAAKKPLKEVFADQTNLKVTDTGDFSWLTGGNVPQNPFMQPRLSEVEGVDQPGPAFMQAVFALAAGAVGVASNEPQTIVYVVQLTEFPRSLDELRADFPREPPMRYMSVANEDRNRLYAAWLSDLEKTAAVHWHRPADSKSGRASATDDSSDDMDY